MDPEEVVHSEDEVVHSEDEVVHYEAETLISTEVERRGATVMYYFSGDWDGALARSLIPLTAFQKWTKVPPELLKLLWAGILHVQPNVDCVAISVLANTTSKPKLTLTRPKEPYLETSHRAWSVKVKSSAELEEELY
ncbi:hypothetical protein IFM89_010414 [Coptis chinensis]|uniref:Uncharacterized protein n=1 Tax=Coptis chinensis TaxID=261450 RepID=A0A835LGU2_9MAGN|nr:hypothetical protein IFM89_010414 [Coptis chinensis]